MPRKRTHDEFVNDISIKNPNIEIIGQYIDNRTHVSVKCLKHDVIWDTIPQSLYLGMGCELCRVEKISSAHRTKRDDFVKAVESINPNVEIIGEYKGQRKQIEVRCKVHNIIWNPRADSILDGRGCKECAKEKQSVALAIPEDEVVSRIAKVSPSVMMIGGYVDTSSRAKFECKTCGNIWYPIVNSVLNGHGCKKCGFNKISEKNRLSNDEFVARLSKINPTIKPLEKYVSGRHSIKMECTSCGKIWSTRPDGLLEGYGCPNCASSKGERAVSTTLDLLGIGYFQEHIFPDCRHKWPLRYDFYIPSINTAIEFQGRQHYEAETSWGGDDGLAERQLRDQIKRDYCADKNICLVEIPYWDIKDVPDIVKNIVMQKEVIACPIQ